jgi:hypothetical protein
LAKECLFFSLYGITPKENVDKLFLCAILNSTLARMFIEFTCRQLTGSQAIADIDVIVVKSLLVPKLEIVSDTVKEELKNAFAQLLKNNAESVFKEIAPSPEEVSFEKVRPDRLELDRIVLQEILGLSEKEHLEVYKAVVDLVKSRLEKAKSVGKKSRKSEASLGVAFADNFYEDLKNGD